MFVSDERTCVCVFRMHMRSRVHICICVFHVYTDVCSRAHTSVFQLDTCLCPRSTRVCLDEHSCFPRAHKYLYTCVCSTCAHVCVHVCTFVTPTCTHMCVHVKDMCVPIGHEHMFQMITRVCVPGAQICVCVHVYANVFFSRTPFFIAWFCSTCTVFTCAHMCVPINWTFLRSIRTHGCYQMSARVCVPGARLCVCSRLHICVFTCTHMCVSRVRTCVF